MDQPTAETSQSPFPPTPAPRSGNIGPLIAAVVIVLLLAAGGFYFFYTEQQKQLAPGAEQAQSGTAAGQQSQADSVESIEADLGATQTTGAEADVTELEGAL